MSQRVQIIITGDFATGRVAVTGPIDDMRIVYWLMGEATRICERMADKKDTESESPIVRPPGGLVV